MARVRASDDYNDNEFTHISDAEDDSATESYADQGDSEAKEIAATHEESPEARSPSQRCRAREQLERDIQAYLLHGGVIHHIDQGSVPPPTSHYQDDYWNPLA